MPPTIRKIVLDVSQLRLQVNEKSAFQMFGFVVGFGILSAAGVKNLYISTPENFQEFINFNKR
jgi:hypothetical protein